MQLLHDICSTFSASCAWKRSKPSRSVSYCGFPA